MKKKPTYGDLEKLKYGHELSLSHYQRPTRGILEGLDDHSILIVRLNEDLDSASETTATESNPAGIVPRTAEGVIYIGAGETQTFRKYVIDGEDQTVTVVNRDTTFSASADSIIKVAPFGDELQPIGGSAGGKLVRIVTGTFSLRRGVHTAIVVKIVTSNPPVVGEQRTIEDVSPPESIVVTNLRDCYLSSSIIYRANKYGNHWCIDPGDILWEAF